MILNPETELKLKYLLEMIESAEKNDARITFTDYDIREDLIYLIDEKYVIEVETEEFMYDKICCQGITQRGKDYLTVLRKKY